MIMVFILWHIVTDHDSEKFWELRTCPFDFILNVKIISNSNQNTDESKET